MSIHNEDSSILKQYGSSMGVSEAVSVKKASKANQHTMHGVHNNKGIAGISYTEGDLTATRSSKMSENEMINQLEKKGADNCNLNQIGDAFIRDLLKLLIHSFAEMLTTQRIGDLYVLNRTMESFFTKIKEMEASKEKQYSAAFTQALAGIIGGAIATGFGLVGGALQIGSTKKITDIEAIGGKVVGTMQSKFGQVGSMLSYPSQAIAQMSNAAGSMASVDASQEKIEADIRATAQDQLQEILRKAQENNQSLDKAVFDYINSIISMMQQLQQSIRQTEMGIVQA